MQVRNTAVNVIAMDKSMEADVIPLLKAKKQAVREAAVDILGKWGAAEYKDILSEAAEKEKSAKLADKINALFDQDGGSSTGVGAGEGVFIASNYVDQLHKGGRAKKLQWLYEMPYHDVKLKNGGKAEEKYLQGILLCYANMDIPGVNKYAVLLAKELDTDDFARYVKEVFSRWVDAGAEAKKKWVLYLSAIHGGSDMIEILVKYIKEWSENSRGAIAAEAVRAVAFNGSPEALMQVDYMAHKYKHKQVKNAAILALSQAADELGITSEELLDRIVPNLGFDENFERIFDYGSRKFKVYLSNTLELEIFDENDKKRKSMPAVSAKDDEVMAKAAVSAFRDMKKQLKNVITIQKLRLENVIVSERRWDYENWQKLFVKNPVMHCFAIGLIWSAYEGDRILKTFRYMEDGSFNTSEEEEYTLPENCTIGLTHPIDLSEEELALWKEQLSDYEIIQPIVQLERTVYRMKEEEKQSLDLERFRGRKINGYTILNRTAKFGWSKGSVQDAGVFSTFFREDVQKRVTKEDGSVETDWKCSRI